MKTANDSSVESVTMPVCGPSLAADIVGKSYVETAFKKIKESKESVWLIDDRVKKQYTYGELLKDSSSIAVKLKKLGIKKNSVVSSIADNSFEALAFQWGTMFSGGVSNPVNQFLKPEELRKCISVSRPELFLCGANYLELLEDSIKNIGFEIRIVTIEKVSNKYLCYEDFLAEDGSTLEVKIDDKDNHVCLALFTSGTTGLPKAVKIKDRSLIINSKIIDWDGYRRVLLTSPMLWISNSFCVGKTTLEGITMIIPAKTDAVGLLKCISTLKPESWFTGASSLMEMAQLPDISSYDTSSIKKLLFGGSYTTLEHKNKIRKTVLNDRNVLMNGYGSTEAGFVTAFFETVPVSSPQYGSIGRLGPGVQLKIVDVSTGKELGPGQDGEICVKTCTQMAGYMNEKSPSSDYDSEGWYHMGDIGHLDDKGYLYYTSRMKELIKYRGVQLSPAEVEEVISRHPEVLEACVVGKPHSIDGEWPAAFVTIRHGSKLTEAELISFVDEKVADSKRLRGGVFFLTSFPRNAVGKVKKVDLLKLLK